MSARAAGDRTRAPEDALERALREGVGEGARERELARDAAERVARRASGEGLAEISYAAADSPFGELLLLATRQGLVRVAFPEEDPDAVLDRVASRISSRIVRASAPLEEARRELDRYFEGGLRDFGVALDWSLIGPFAQRVLHATAAIPYGGTLTYTQVAAQAGSPRGSRAAGNALGSNPIPIVIPCHRVLRAGGALGGYGGGLPRKRFLLELEGALPTQQSL